MLIQVVFGNTEITFFLTNSKRHVMIIWYYSKDLNFNAELRFRYEFRLPQRL